MSTKQSAEKGTTEKQKAAEQPGKDDVHEQREHDQQAEGMVKDPPKKSGAV